MIFEDGTHVTVELVNSRELTGKIKVLIDGVEEKEATECLTGENGWLLTATDDPHLAEDGESIALYRKEGKVEVVYS